MESVKQLVLKHFEEMIVAIIFVIAFVGTYLIEEISLILNFYYLPVLVSSYFLGRRIGILAMLFPHRFFGEPVLWHNIVRLSSWSVFLFLVSIVVGTLCEQNERRVQGLKRAYIGILEILAKFLESTDRYTEGHSVRVAELSMDIAIAMEMPRAQVENIRVAGLLHDIGKIMITTDVLCKAGELSEEERELINSHSQKGGDILSTVGPVLKEAVPIVVAHHKYFNDTVDADDRDKQKIPLGARIVAVADAFDAMTTDRPYRKARPPWDAFEEVVAKSGKQFDPEVVEAFKRVVSERMERV
jgi:putative nucleotidyltransferase with HDIG domain